MSKVILTLDSMPKSCDKCPLFINHFGQKAYCAMGAKYTPEEISSVEDGNLEMYYHGCLSNRPKSCPLKEESKKKFERPKAEWITHDYEAGIVFLECSRCKGMQSRADHHNFCPKCGADMRKDQTNGRIIKHY